MKTTVCLFLLLFPFINNAQQPGTLDKSFGDNGVAIDKEVFGLSNVIALQSDGKIIAAGGMSLNNKDPQLIARYNTDGSRDKSFGTNGLTGADELSEVFGMTVQKDDAIIALGHTSWDIKLAKYKKDGGLDSTFGTNGTVITNVGNADIPGDVAIQPDGKIVVGGYIINADNEDRQGFLIRYLHDGSLDKSFGNEGISVFTAINEEESFISLNSIALQPDGKIVAAVSTDVNNVYRFNADGSLDKSFGTGGEARFEGAYASISYIDVKRIAVQPDGKIVGCGNAYGGAQRIYMAAARLNADGSVDKEFGQNGLQYVQFGDYNSQGKAILLQSDGKIVCTGNIYNSDVAITRFNQDGQLDSTFGINGQTLTDGEGATGASSAALQKDGKIVLGGYAAIGSGFDIVYYNFLARYNNDDNKKQPLMVRIKRWLQHHGISWQYNPNVRYYSVQRSADGGITYKEIAKVNSNTNTYEDAAAQAATANALYRLAAVAKDGSCTYSNTVSIDATQQAIIFPNPVQSNLQLQGLPATGKTAVSVLDLNGTVRSTATATGTNYSVNTTNLGSGSYLLKIQHNGMATTLPFIKE